MEKSHFRWTNSWGAGHRLITCRLDELHPHPSYVLHHLAVPARKLAALAELGDLAFLEPIVITRDGTVLDGYARWELARLQNRETLPCIRYDLTEVEALCWLLQRHCRSSGLNDFCRVLLALELEPSFKEKASQVGKGHHKGSSNLTKVEGLDVRREVADAAGVSVGNVTKVKQLKSAAHPDLVEALRSGEIRIHRAWLWSKAPSEDQREELRRYRSERGVKKIIRSLVSRHRANGLPTIPDPGSILRRLGALDSRQLASVSVSVIKSTGKAIFVTEGLVQSLQPYQEEIPTCATINR